MSRPHPHTWDVVNRHRAWFKELGEEYLGISWAFYCELYAQEREAFNRLVLTDPHRAFTKTAWCLLRQPFYHRWAQWRERGVAMPPHGAVLDWGCGTGEMLMWLHAQGHRGPLHGHDLDSPQYKYMQWRLGQRGRTNGLLAQYDVVVCRETLEHIPDPVEVVQDLMQRVRPGGTLLWDFIDAHDGGANCAPPAARKEVLHMLNAQHEGQHETWRKPLG